MKFAYAAILMACLLLPASGHAQQPPDTVNCAALQGSPLICFKNYSSLPITGVMTGVSGAFGSDWTSPPGPPCPPPISRNCIMPSGTSIMSIPTGWSGMRTMVVQTADGQTRKINQGRPFDIHGTTSVLIRY